MGRNGLPADPFELVHGRPEGDGADDVGGTGLLTLGRIGPDDLVEVDQVDGATTGEEGVTVLEDPARPDERAGAEGRVELVTAEGHEVGSLGEGTVRCQLCRVEQDGDPAGMGLGTDLLDRG